MTTGSVIEDLEVLKVQQSSLMCYNMATIKTIIELILIFSISRPDLLCFGFCLNNHNARNRHPKW